LALKVIAQGLKDTGVDAAHHGDNRVYRLHLMVEELSEVAEALADMDEASYAHELTDLLYTVVGCYDTNALPMELLFDEVHRANMSKRRRDDDYRMKDKGDGFVPANIGLVLKEFYDEAD
jgi:predicted HAD superfamily Cof-like phosphohydrolase